jgi:signal peptidase I
MENNMDSENNPTPITQESVPVKKTKWKENAQNAWDLIKFAAIALAIVIPIRLFVAQPFVVSGESMFPTFNDGQYLIVDELSYLVGTPHRGDVVIFRYPIDPSRFFIKRVIGLPGEKVEIKNGAVTIFNKDHPEGFTLNEPYIDEPFSANYNNTVPADQYFVMGDNRNRSSDSRAWGFVPKKLMVGRAYVRLLPLTSISYLPGAYKETK